eukprot:TRINITY_DN13520_c0_g1_i2.p1 TRINITY_DN13520_c0_g1~~TRINITY_DN13520_c0_g1_i2.p1  ORF type:complete len:116 (-),score=24.93 TRINITY_DN13520_c0_g1_i2:107-409(-)
MCIRDRTEITFEKTGIFQPSRSDITLQVSNDYFKDTTILSVIIDPDKGWSWGTYGLILAVIVVAIIIGFWIQRRRSSARRYREKYLILDEDGPRRRLLIT